MQDGCFHFVEDRAQTFARNRRGLIRSNHKDGFTAASAPLFDRTVTSSDNQHALGLDRYFCPLLFCHGNF